MSLRHVLYRPGRIFLVALAAAVAVTFFGGGQAPAKEGTVLVKLETSLGEIVVELYPDKAPLTCENFIGYVKSGFYDGTIFHRVVPGFVIQGGGLTPKMEQKKTNRPVKNEADNGLVNEPYTLSMARTQDPHSATSQFFVNLAANAFLDHRSKTPEGWGYAVFAKVVQGQEVVDKIGAVATGNRGPYADVPKETVTILKAALEDGKN